MSHDELETYLLTFPNTWLDFPFGEGTYVYKVGHKETGEGKLFAIIDGGSKPLRVSLKCDPQLAELLRQKYESVIPGYHLNKKHWNTVICDGEVDDTTIFEWIDDSHDLVFNALSKKLQAHLRDT